MKFQNFITGIIENIFFNSSLKPITKNFPTTNKKLPNY